MTSAVMFTEIWNCKNFLTEVDASTPHDGQDNVRKRVVHEDDVGSLLGNFGTSNAHSETDIGKFESRSIIGTVTRNTNDFAHRFQRLDQESLVFGGGSSENLQSRDDLKSLSVGESSEYWP